VSLLAAEVRSFGSLEEVFKGRKISNLYKRFRHCYLCSIVSRKERVVELHLMCNCAS